MQLNIIFHWFSFKYVTMATKLWFSGHLVIPFTINHKSIHWSLFFFYRHSKLEFFWNVRPLRELITHYETLLKIYYTLKTPGSAWPGKGSIIGANLHSGSTMTRKSVNLTRNMTQSWVNLTPIICQVCRKLTKFRVTFDPERSMTPMNPFPAHDDQGIVLVDLSEFPSIFQKVQHSHSRHHKTTSNPLRINLKDKLRFNHSWPLGGIMYITMVTMV